MGIELERFDEHLERITTREQAERHLRRILEVDGAYNQSMYAPEIELDPSIPTDITIQFRTDDNTVAETAQPYSLFLDRYELENDRIPRYKFQIATLLGRPCLRVRISE